MPALSTATKVVQVGLETTRGIAVPANRQLRSIRIEPDPKASIQMLGQAGGKFPIAQALGREWVEADVGGYLTYTEIVYLLSSLMGEAEIAQINPPAGLGYSWVFSMKQQRADDVATFTVEVGNEAQAVRFAYGIVNELSISFDRESVEIDGKMFGRRLETATLTASPALVEVVPVVPTQVAVFIDSTYSAIGTTRLARVLSAKFEISDRFNPVWTLDNTTTSFADHVETQPKATLTLMVEGNLNDPNLLNAMRAGAKRFIRVVCLGPEIEAGVNHKFQLDMCGVVSEAFRFSDEDGVWAAEWTFQAAYDPDWGHAVRVEVVNTLPSL